jgi:hypothetical protein
MSMHVAILILVILSLIVNLALVYFVWKAVIQLDIPKIITEKDKVIKDIGAVRSTVDSVKKWRQ